MEYNFEFPIDIVSITFSIIAWSILSYWVYCVNRNKPVKVKMWKALVVTFVGIFSFTINWSIFDTFIRFPILPLGVGLLFWYFRRKEGKWKKYRPFAWMGFFSNFIFLVVSLLTPIIHNQIYAINVPSTYISDIEDARIIKIHPTAIYDTINMKKLREQLQKMHQEKIWSEKWYQDTYHGEKPKYERFPYQLTGTSPKWGSGIEAIIYIEKDGKGILIDTPKQQVYFYSEEVFLGGGQEND